MTKRTYASPAAFKQALEQRLREATGSGPKLARRRQLLVFNRFLARIVHVLGDAAILKGGLVLELRLSRARTTKDIDLRLMGSPERVLERLQEAARLDLGDFLAFEVVPDDDHPDIQNDGMQYDGLRFRTECHLAGKLYGQRFGVDVAFGDPILGEPEVVTADDVLGFIGIAPPALRLYPVETHIAEKLHAYTMPRARPNSRVKDLPDIALLASIGVLEANSCAAPWSRPSRSARRTLCRRRSPTQIRPGRRHMRRWPRPISSRGLRWSRSPSQLGRFWIPCSPHRERHAGIQRPGVGASR